MRLMASSRRASCSCVAYAVGFVGGEEMRHHAFKPQRRAWPEAREDCGEIAEASALAAHAGVNLKMDGHGTGLRSGGTETRAWALPALTSATALSAESVTVLRVHQLECADVEIEAGRNRADAGRRADKDRRDQPELPCFDSRPERDVVAGMRDCRHYRRLDLLRTLNEALVLSHAADRTGSCQALMDSLAPALGLSNRTALSRAPPVATLPRPMGPVRR